MIKLLRKCFRTSNQIVRDFLSEFIATFFLVVFAVGSGAQYVLSRQTLSSFLTVNFAGGMGLALGIYFGGGVSGGYVNPAVALGFCLSGRIPWSKYPVFVPAQFLGAFTAAAVNYGLYIDAINHYDGGNRSVTGPEGTAGIFVTFPQEYVSTTTAFFDEVFCTFVLVGASLAITDRRNMLPNNGFLPVALGSVVFAIGTSFGMNSGYAINPARDLSPRIFIALAGWGKEVFTYRDYYFWVPIVGPLTGGILASLLYSLFIEIHWPDESKDEEILSNQKEEKVQIEEQNGKDNPVFLSGSNMKSSSANDQSQTKL